MKTPIPTFFSRSTFGVTIALLAGIVPASHGLAQTPASFAATINGEPQPQERAQLLLQEQLARGVANTPQLQSVLRETLINHALMAQAAVKAGLDQQPQVRARLDLARQNALSLAWQQQVLQSVRPSDADIRAEYQRQIQALGTQEVRLRNVLVADEKQAIDIHSKIKGGTPFSEMVTQFSTDAATRDAGGMTNWVSVGILSPGVLKALQGLEIGQLAAAPVETAAGWQVLSLEARRPFVAPHLDQVRPQVVQALAKAALQAQLKALRESAKVE